MLKNSSSFEFNFKKFNLPKSIMIVTSNLFFFSAGRITFPETASSTKKRKHGEEDPKEVKQELLVEPFVVPNRGPYPFNQPKK